MVKDDILSFKYLIDKFLLKSGLDKESSDWWSFAKIYENIKGKSSVGQSRNSGRELNSSTNKYKDNLTNSFLKYLNSYEGRHIPIKTKESIKDITFAFLNFKKKQDEVKIKKVLESQKNLPVYQFREEIVNVIKNERVIIIAGDTGCGKSTQVPQYLLKEGLTGIACTQPRRIACISLCRRVACELQNEYCDQIGYQIRFDKHCKEGTKLLFITEGLLLRQIALDGSLSRYNIVLLDEIHERHLQGDFLLGVLKCLLHQRKDFKLVLMSATINTSLFSSYFGSNVKVINIPGRLFPIEVHYFPKIMIDKDEKKGEKINPSPYLRILQLIEQKYPSSERGDVLIFLSGINEIKTVVDAALQYNEKSKKWIILPLHSSLSLSDQDKVFDYAPEGYRKCVVSTNIAETSVTIDGIRFVIDSGAVKEMGYDPVTKMQRLKEFQISRASAEQRKGRAGRTGPGVCYRIYSEEDYSAFQEYSTPEIHRVPLDSVLLQMISMGLPDARKFPFLEMPAEELIENAVASLKQIDALSDGEKLTPLGQMLSMLPIDLNLGKMLINASLFCQIEYALSLSAALSVNPYTYYAFKDSSAVLLRSSCESDHGDPLTLLNSLKEWLQIKIDSLNSKTKLPSKKWTKARGFEEQRFYEMIDLRTQFKRLMEESSFMDLEGQTSHKLTAAERVFRKGEVKLLKQLKRKHDDDVLKQNKKMLKPDSWNIDDCELEDNHDHKMDAKDINFRLSKDRSQIKDLINGVSIGSSRDLILLKVIILSGMYPQVAIPDEFNHYKEVSNKLYHTKDKPFVFLHPQSGFSNNHQSVLQLDEKDIIEVPGIGKEQVSYKHQLLCYVSLLETNKPYLVNTLRMPLAQSFLLFSKQIHTNADFSIIICDSWIQMKFPNSEAIEKLILKIIKIRNTWDELLKLKMEGSKILHDVTDFSAEIYDVMKSEVCYNYKRLLQADLKVCYKLVSDEQSFSDYNPLQENFKIFRNIEFGGLQLTPYLTYNCLMEEHLQTNNLEKSDCPSCGSLYFTPLEKLQHHRMCSTSLKQ